VSASIPSILVLSVSLSLCVSLLLTVYLFLAVSLCLSPSRCSFMASPARHSDCRRIPPLDRHRTEFQSSRSFRLQLISCCRSPWEMLQSPQTALNSSLDHCGSASRFSHSDSHAKLSDPTTLLEVASILPRGHGGPIIFHYPYFIAVIDDTIPEPYI
jgi:hypothetical protein